MRGIVHGQAPRPVRRGENGQAVVEFALILIPFLFLMMGLLDLGRGVFVANVPHVTIAPIAAAGLFYLVVRRAWVQVNGDSVLDRSIAWSSLLIGPLVVLSSVGAYRFALYFWPFAMAVWAGVPALIDSGPGRLFYRLVVVIVAFAMLIGWLTLGNNSFAWLPYQSWLLQPAGAPLVRPHSG